MPIPRPITIANTRFLKDDVNSYSDDVIEIAKRLDANLILLSFTGTSGEDKERWNWRLIKPFVQHAHDEGLLVSFYMKLTNINWKPMFHERPESQGWLMRYADGSPALYQGSPDRYMGCLNNPSWRQHLKDMIATAVEYEPDALFYDNCFVPRALAGSGDDEAAAKGWACYCDVCREKFREYTLRKLGWECELPSPPKWDDPIWQAFVEFRDEYFVDAMTMVVDYAHELRPDIVVYPNVAVPWMGGGGAKGSATHMIADKVDLILLERRGAPRLESPPAGGMPRAINAVVDWKYGTRVKSTPIWYRQNKPGSHTPDQMKIGLAEASAFNGATHHIMAALFTHEHIKADIINHFYTWLQKHERFYVDARPVADVAMHVSTPTINWYYPDQVARGAAELPQSIPGLAQALVELHVPFNVVLDDDLTTDHGYRVLVLPNSACMSDSDAEGIRSFVENGGGLVATGDTSLYDERYRIREDFALAEVFGVHHGQAVTGIVKNEYGKGRCAFLPGHPDERFWHQGISTDLALFQEAMGYVLDGDRQIEIDAPTTVVMNVTETADGDTTLVHLINYDVQLTETQKAFGIDEVPPVTSTLARRVLDMPVTLRKPDNRAVKRVRLYSTDLDKGLDLDFEESDRAVSFEIPVLWIYDVIAVDWE
jgi:hypothetical protein